MRRQRVSSAEDWNAGVSEAVGGGALPVRRKTQ